MRVEDAYPDVDRLSRLKIRHRDRIMNFDRVTAHIPPDGAVLDVGCGIGLLNTRLSLARHPAALAGVDIAKPAIAVARAAGAKLSAAGFAAPVYCDGASLAEWPTARVATVVLIDVLHHVPVASRPEFLDWCYARVAPGGRLVVKDMSPSPWWCGLGNRLHDLALAREWIVYQPMPAVAAHLTRLGARALATDQWRQLWYAHSLAVFARDA